MTPMFFATVLSGFVLGLKMPKPWLSRRQGELQILAAISHELRTPLHTIMGVVHLLKRGGMTEEETRHALDCIERNVKLEAGLVDQLLDARLEPLIAKAPIDLREPVAAAVERMREIASGKGVVIESYISDEPLTVAGDRQLLHEVATHLLGNAVKFTPAGGRITVGVAPRGRSAVLRVADDGEGIANEDLPHIFEPFRQGLFQWKRSGLGLGLAIARERVLQHGGTISAHSGGKGRGARFCVTLPLVSSRSD